MHEIYVAPLIAQELENRSVPICAGATDFRDQPELGGDCRDDPSAAGHEVEVVPRARPETLRCVVVDLDLNGAELYRDIPGEHPRKVLPLVWQPARGGVDFKFSRERSEPRVDSGPVPKEKIDVPRWNIDSPQDRRRSAYKTDVRLRDMPLNRTHDARDFVAVQRHGLGHSRAQPVDDGVEGLAAVAVQVVGGAGDLDVVLVGRA